MSVSSMYSVCGWTGNKAWEVDQDQDDARMRRTEASESRRARYDGIIKQPKWMDGWVAGVLYGWTAELSGWKGQGVKKGKTSHFFFAQPQAPMYCTADMGLV